MSAAIMSVAKTVFDDQLEGSERWLNWIEGAKKFQDAVKGGLDWNQIKADDRTFVSDRLNAVAPTQQVLLNSLYLTMVSSFEEYLRSCIRRVAEKFSSAQNGYDELFDEIRNTHAREAGRLLARIDSLPDYLSVNIDDLCREIGSCVVGSKQVRLSSQALSNVDGLIKLDNFIDRMSCLGVTLTFDGISADRGIKSALKLDKGGAREVAKALRQELEAVAKMRNRIAHTGPTATDVTQEIANSHRVLFRAISSVIESKI